MSVLDRRKRCCLRTRWIELADPRLRPFRPNVRARWNVRRPTSHPRRLGGAPTAISAPTDAGEIQYRYQWWLAEDAKPGEYFARDIYGQYIYTDTPNNVAIAAKLRLSRFRGRARFRTILRNVPLDFYRTLLTIQERHNSIGIGNRH